MLHAASGYASPGRARILPPGRPSWSGSESDALEGYARTFLLLAFRVAAGAPPGALLARYADGLAAGTDPAHPEAWPRIGPDCRQAAVEAYAIAYGLHLTRPWLWDGLDDGVRSRVVDWLSGVFGWQLPDIYGHVNNAVYYTYMDTVINSWLIREGGLDIHHGNVIGLCVQSHCEFKAPAAYPETLRAGLRVGRLGRSSVRYEVGLFRDDTLLAEGHFVHVFVDRETRRPTPVGDKLRSALTRLT